MKKIISIFMKKVVLLFLFFVFSKSLFSQWVVQNFDDGFDKSTLIRTEIYEYIGEYGYKSYSYLTFSKGFGLYPSLYFVSNCSTGEKNRRWAIKILLTVNGVEKEYNALDYAGYSYKKVFTLNNSCLDIRLDKESLDDFLNATYVKIKASNSAYDPIYFQMKLNPVKTQEAWNLETGGKYFEEKKQKEEQLKIEQKKEQERIALEKQRKEEEKQRAEEDTKTIKKINELLEGNFIEEAVTEYNNLHIKYDSVTNTIKSKLDLLYNSEANISSLNSYTVEDYIQKNKSILQSIPAGVYALTFDKKGIPNHNNFPNLINVPQKTIGDFKIFLKSIAEIRVEEKDSLLISTNYTSGSTKELYFDNNENFYFKSKTGLTRPKYVSFNPNLEKDIVQVNKTYKKEKYINGVLVTSRTYSSGKNVKILKKDY